MQQDDKTHLQNNTSLLLVLKQNAKHHFFTKPKISQKLFLANIIKITILSSPINYNPINNKKELL